MLLFLLLLFLLLVLPPLHSLLLLPSNDALNVAVVFVTVVDVFVVATTVISCVAAFVVGTSGFPSKFRATLAIVATPFCRNFGAPTANKFHLAISLATSVRD